MFFDYAWPKVSSYSHKTW